MTSTRNTEPLKMVRGGLYRNPLDVELRVLEHLYMDDSFKRYAPLFESSFGSIWVIELYTSLGNSLHLATPEGLESCGYKLVTDPEAER